MAQEPAFPHPNRDFTEAYGGAPGMTMRDYFAAHAFAIMSGRSWDYLQQTDGALIGTWAKTAYAIADAMLIARSEGDA